VETCCVAGNWFIVCLPDGLHIEAKENQVLGGDAPHKGAETMRPSANARIACVRLEPVSRRARYKESDGTSPDWIFLRSEEGFQQKSDVLDSRGVDSDLAFGPPSTSGAVGTATGSFEIDGETEGEKHSPGRDLNGGAEFTKD
jgi:hypothetical protein